MTTFYQAEVKGVFLSAHSAEELAEAVADVKAGVPLLTAKMRVGKVTGEVWLIDKERKTARLRWVERTDDGRAIRRVERDFPWSKLRYA